jgi:hypothetical protein
LTFQNTQFTTITAAARHLSNESNKPTPPSSSAHESQPRIKSTRGGSNKTTKKKQASTTPSTSSQGSPELSLNDLQTDTIAEEDLIPIDPQLLEGMSVLLSAIALTFPRRSAFSA